MTALAASMVCSSNRRRASPPPKPTETRVSSTVHGEPREGQHQRGEGQQAGHVQPPARPAGALVADERAHLRQRAQRHAGQHRGSRSGCGGTGAGLSARRSSECIFAEACGLVHGRRSRSERLGARRFRQREVERRALLHLCLGPHAATVAAHDALHGGEADAEALELTQAVQALEGAEELVGDASCRSRRRRRARRRRARRRRPLTPTSMRAVSCLAVNFQALPRRLASSACTNWRSAWASSAGGDREAQRRVPARPPQAPRRRRAPSWRRRAARAPARRG